MSVAAAVDDDDDDDLQGRKQAQADYIYFVKNTYSKQCKQLEFLYDVLVF